MKNKIILSMNKLFHDYAIAELRLQNNKETKTDLTYNDILYLSIISAHSGEYTASNIADMLYVSRPAVTQKINELEKRGFIYKVQSQVDKRVYKLFINKEQNKYYEKIEETDLQIAIKISSEYSEEQISMFCEMTDKICEIVLNETKRGDV